MMLQPLNHIWINQVSFKIPSPIRPYPPETLPSVLPPFPSPAVGCLEVATPRRSRSPSRAARLWLWPWPWRRPGRPRPARPRRLRGRYEGSEEYLKIIYILYIYMYVIIYYNMYIYIYIQQLTWLTSDISFVAIRLVIFLDMLDIAPHIPTSHHPWLLNR